MRTLLTLTLLLGLAPWLAWGAPSERGLTIEYTEPSTSQCPPFTQIMSVSSGLVITQVTPNAVQAGSDHADKAKRFAMVKLPDGSYNLKSELNGLCMGMANGDTTQARGFTFDTCGNGTNQQFEIGPSPSTIKPLHNLSMCADVAGDSREPGASVGQWPCHGGANQSWTYTPTGEDICPLDDLDSTIIYTDVVPDGQPGEQTQILATAPSGGGTITQKLCIPLLDDATADRIEAFVTAVDTAGNESRPTETAVLPVAGGGTCQDPPSPNCTEAVTVVDMQGAVWTFRADRATLRNGVHMSGGFADRYLLADGKLYALAGANWYRWHAPNWVNVGQTRPACTPSDLPPATPADFRFAPLAAPP